MKQKRFTEEQKAFALRQAAVLRATGTEHARADAGQAAQDAACNNAELPAPRFATAFAKPWRIFLRVAAPRCTEGQIRR